MPRILLRTGIFPCPYERSGVSADDLKRVLFAWDQNGFRDPDKQRCYVCNAPVLVGEYRVCEKGCSTVFCDPCASKYFVEEECCARVTSPTYPDHRQMPLRKFLEGPPVAQGESVSHQSGQVPKRTVTKSLMRPVTKATRFPVRKQPSRAAKRSHFK